MFFDDILVYSKGEKEHLQHLEVTLTLLQQHDLFAKKIQMPLCLHRNRILRAYNFKSRSKG